MSLGRAALAAACVLVAPAWLQGQAADPNAQYPRPVMEFDPGTMQVKGALPFGELFLFKVAVPDGVVGIRVDVGKPVFSHGTRSLGDSMALATIDVKAGLLRPPAVSFPVPPLEPREVYDFKITYYTAGQAGQATGPLEPATLRITGRTETTFASHLTTDLGVLGALRTGYVGAVTTLHVYAVPINKREALALGGPSDFAKRISAFVGLTPLEIASDAPVHKLYGLGSPVAGVGFRVTRSIRAGTGVMFFEQTDANPLVTERVAKRDTFVMVTIDVDYKSILGPIGALLGT